MKLSNNDAPLLKSYLLGQLTGEEQQRVEERLLVESDLVERLEIIEDELIESYVDEELEPDDREKFKGYFLRLPARQRKLNLAKSLRKIALKKTPVLDEAFPQSVAASAATAPHPALKAQTIWQRWLQASVLSPLKPALALIITLLVVLVGWQVYRRDIEQTPTRLAEGVEFRDAKIALKNITGRQRPYENRLTGSEYAPYIELRGASPSPTGGAAQRQTELRLLDLVAKRPGAASRRLLGLFYLYRKELDGAISQLEAAVQDSPNDARLRSDLGVALLEKGKALRAGRDSGRGEEYVGKSLAQLRQAHELDGSLREALFNLALIEQQQGLTNQAIESWKKYLALDHDSEWAQEAKSRLTELEEKKKRAARGEEALLEDFLLAYRQKDADRAWESFSQSRLWTGSAVSEKLLDAFREESKQGRREQADEKIQALIYAGELEARRSGESFTADLARFYQRASLSRLTNLSDARDQASLGYRLSDGSNFDEAIKSFDKAKKTFSQAGDLWEASVVEYAIGHCLYRQSALDRSLAVFERLSQTCEENDFKWLLALTFNGLINVHVMFNEYSKALDYSLRALKIAETIHDPIGEMRNYVQLSEIYCRLGKYVDSLYFTHRGLSFGTGGNGGAGIALVSNQILELQQTAALDYLALDLNPVALSYQMEAAEQAATKGPLIASRAYVKLGRILGRMRDLPAAEMKIKQALSFGANLQETSSGKDIAGYAYLHRGNLLEESGQSGEAIASYDQAINLFSQSQQKLFLYQAYRGLMISYLKRGDDAGYQAHIPSFLKIFEELRARTLEESNRNSLFESEQSVCDGLIGFAFTKLNDRQSAFGYSELCKARSLLDLIGANPQIKLDRSLPDTRVSLTRQPLEPAEICARLPEQTQILEYAVLEDQVLMWVASRNGITAASAPISAQKLTAAVVGYQQKLLNPAKFNREELRGEAVNLYNQLIKPVEQLLDRNKLTCIVPDKVLNYLPFVALISPNSNKYLVEERRLVFSPSANIFLLLSEAANKKAGNRPEQILSVGNPHFDRDQFPIEDLPSAKTEAEDALACYRRGWLLTGDNAREQKVKDLMEKADVIHFATHYVADEQSPMLSKLLLAKEPAGADQADGPERVDGVDGVLQPHEIYRLKLPQTRLVVLSACQTGVERYYQGEGMIGLARPFLAAEAPLVVASLWQVDSKATGELLTRFHRIRKTRSVSSIEALRQAQAEMLGHPITAYQHPYFWASFAAIGGETSF